MISTLKYVPIFRSKQQELLVLKSFDFEDQIYPCLEIIKELDRAQKPDKPNGQIPLFGKPNEKSFEDCYTSIIQDITAKKVFIDLPIHLKQTRNMKKQSLLFLRTVVTKREMRTNYIKKLKHLANKIIPVISTYEEISGEVNSICIQENDLRSIYKSLAFRVFPTNFKRDLEQIKKCVRKEDYIFIDYDNDELDENDWEALDIKKEIEKIDAHIIIHRNPISESATMTGLEHLRRIDTIDNSLPFIFSKLGGHSFSDYAGIKKDNITEGGIQSPGFIFYDGVTNNFFGYRYKHGGHKKGEQKPELIEFETTIVPAVINSEIVTRMQADTFDYLHSKNWGWQTIMRIKDGLETGKSAAKFKRISMEHYLHCIKLKLKNKHFELS